MSEQLPPSGHRSRWGNTAPRPYHETIHDDDDIGIGADDLDLTATDWSTWSIKVLKHLQNWRCSRTFVAGARKFCLKYLQEMKTFLERRGVEHPPHLERPQLEMLCRQNEMEFGKATKPANDADIAGGDEDDDYDPLEAFFEANGAPTAAPAVTLPLQ